MPEWSFYAATGFYDKEGRFSPEQLDDRLEVGLMPAIVTNPKANNLQTINGLYKYLKSKEAGGLPLKITSHGRGEFIDLGIPQVKESIDMVIKLNQRYGSNVIGEIDFHAGALHTFEEEYGIRKKSLGEGIIYGDTAATFTAEEYWNGRETAKRTIKKIYVHAKKHGIEVLIENVAQNNFATREYLDILKRTGRALDYTIEDLDNDVRFGKTKWIPEELQLGDFGCATDLDTITPGGLCIDVDHLGITVDYSRKNNFATMGKPRMGKYEEKVFRECGVFFRKGESPLFEKEIDPREMIESIGDRIKMCHVIGYSGEGMFYWDRINERRVKKISTHMPVLFEGDEDPLGIIKSDEVRTELGKRTRKILDTYLNAFHKVGVRKAVTEIHVGPVYWGRVWKDYHRTSLRNIKSVLGRN